jgi:hypothetical protein
MLANRLAACGEHMTPAEGCQEGSDKSRRNQHFSNTVTFDNMNFGLTVADYRIFKQISSMCFVAYDYLPQHWRWSQGWDCEISCPRRPLCTAAPGSARPKTDP